MPISTYSELRATFEAALAKQADQNSCVGPDAIIRAAVDVVLAETEVPFETVPGHATVRWSERMRRRNEFLALADAIQGGNHA